jgi:flavodoxin
VLGNNAISVESYDTIFLGFPIWGETVPAVIRSFLSSHDPAGKNIVPFITHGGYGLGDSYAVLTRHAPNARLIQGFALQADQERKTMESVNAWLTDLNVAIATTGSKTR